MTPVALLGILLGFAAVPIVVMPRSPRFLTALAFLACCVHLLCAFLYFEVALATGTDAGFYYYDAFGWARSPGWFGTIFMVKFTQALKSLLGGSFFDYFIIFHGFGFWGVAILFRIFQDVSEELRVPLNWSLLLLLLPGMYFWTSGLGKEALIFPAICLGIWASMRLPQRALGMGVAIALMALIRPHVALMAVAALGITQFTERRSSFLSKLALAGAACAVAISLLGTLQNAIGLDLSEGVVSSVMQKREAMAVGSGGGGSAVSNAPYPILLLSLLFRPFFFDANNALSLVASVENLALLYIVGFVVFHLRSAIEVARNVYFLRFSIIFSLMVILLLSVVYYNVGLGLRQKTMFYPGLLTFFVAHFALHRLRQRSAWLARAQRGADPGTQPVRADFA